MSQAREKSSGSGLPSPKIKPLRWPLYLIWIVPILAGIAGVAYYIDYRNERAQEIIIRFSDAAGLKAGQTEVNHLGVQLGMVSAVELSQDRSAALVHVQLNRASLDFARGGTAFWIERAQVSAGSISGLTTVVSGPYIDGIPGQGPPATQFTGLDKKPIVQSPGLKILLHTPRLEHIQRDSVVYFRGIQVGVVQGVQLNPNASGVDIHLFIWQRYATLVHTDSQFWVENGIDFSGGLFSGLKFNVESLRAVLAGGIAFATPDDNEPAANQGAEFVLNDQPKKDWLNWATRIPFPPDNSEDGDKEETPKPAALQKIDKAATQPQR